MFDAVPPAPDEFSAFYRRYQPLVFAIAARMLRERSDAEDAVQVVFLKLWSDPRCFRGGNIESWLTTVTKNACVDELRRIERARRALPQATGDECANVEDEALSRLLFLDVSDALHELNAKQRAALCAAILFDQTHAAIAARYNLPLGTVKTRVRAGLAHVRRKLFARRI